MNYYVKKALRDPQFMLFFVLAVILILIPILAPWIAPNDPIENDYANLMIAHSDKYPLGTDQIGRCFLSRLIYGGRTSLLIVFIVIVISAGVGIILGVLAGYLGGKVDTLITRFTDIVIAVPHTVFVIALETRKTPTVVTEEITDCPVYSSFVGESTMLNT